jgi:hypothetical protein
LNFTNNETQNKTSQTENNSANNPSAIKSLLSALSPSINGENKNETPTKNVQEKITAPPLQRGMLSTLKTHDEFIKRVKQNNKV